MTVYNMMLLAGCLLALVHSSVADTPANCSYADVVGKWTIYETARGYDNTLTGCMNVTQGSLVNGGISFFRSAWLWDNSSQKVGDFLVKAERLLGGILAQGRWDMGIFSGEMFE